MSETNHRVAIITGGSQGIGAGLVSGYLGRGWSVVASARKIKPSEDPDLLTVAGDIAEPATAGRIDTLVNNAGVFISKPFTDYTAEDYALITVAVSPLASRAAASASSYRPRPLAKMAAVQYA